MSLLKVVDVTELLEDEEKEILITYCIDRLNINKIHMLTI